MSDPEHWQTDAPGPFVTIRAGGPLDGVVTITAIAGGNGRSVVEAAWTQDGEECSESLQAATYDMARAIANAGSEPVRCRQATESRA